MPFKYGPGTYLTYRIFFKITNGPGPYCLGAYGHGPGP